MYPQSLLKRRGKLIPNSVLQCYLIHILSHWGETCSEHSLMGLRQWDVYMLESMIRDGYLKNYRPCSEHSKCHKMNLKRTVLCQFCFINAFFYSQAAFLKTKQQLSSWIVASGHREHVMILIFQKKSHPKCQLDIDSYCSQTFSLILRLIRGQQRVLLAFASLHTRSGAFGTDTSHMSVRFYCECKCLGSILWPGRLNVVYVLFLL